MSSNAVSIGRAALLVVDARRLLDAWLSVAALSFEAAAADPGVLDSRIHSWRHRPGQAAVAARMRQLLEGLEPADPRPRTARRPGPVPVPSPAPSRRRRPRCALRARGDCRPRAQLRRRERADHRRARTSRCQTATRTRRRSPTRSTVCARRSHQSAALIARARQHAARFGIDRAAAVPGPQAGSRDRGRWCSSTPHTRRSPRSVRWSPRWRRQTVSVSRGVESHSSLAPIAARRAHEALSGAARRGRDRARGGGARAAARRQGAAAGPAPARCGSWRPSPQSGPRRPPAAPRRRGRATADRGLGVRARLSRRFRGPGQHSGCLG